MHPALPAYSGEGADEDDDGSASDTQLAAEVDSALADDNLNALAQVTRISSCHAPNPSRLADRSCASSCDCRS